jgi:hypothetical protein
MTWLRRWFGGSRPHHAPGSDRTDELLERLTRHERRLERTNEKLKAEHQRISDVASRCAPLRPVPDQLRSLTARLATLEQIAAATDRLAPYFLSPPASLREPALLQAHVQAALSRAVLEQSPEPHAVVDEILPRDLYEYLLAALPPPECFQVHDAFKQDFYPDQPDTVPPLSRLVWQQFERDVVDRMLMPALCALFQPVIEAHYARLLGDELAPAAAALRTRANGRVLLRRPGYRQAPHLDPKRVLMTGILYLARPGDPDDYGTALYHVDRPVVQPVMHTFYPEPAGYTCTLATRVAFRPNRLFAFLNGPAAHGAELPADAPLQERYAYQFYIKPAGLGRVVSRLPDEQRALWAGLPGIE